MSSVTASSSSTLDTFLSPFNLKALVVLIDGQAVELVPTTSNSTATMDGGGLPRLLVRYVPNSHPPRFEFCDYMLSGCVEVTKRPLSLHRFGELAEAVIPYGPTSFDETTSPIHTSNTLWSNTFCITRHPRQHSFVNIVDWVKENGICTSCGKCVSWCELRKMPPTPPTLVTAMKAFSHTSGSGLARKKLLQQMEVIEPTVSLAYVMLECYRLIGPPIPTTMSSRWSRFVNSTAARTLVPSEYKRSFAFWESCISLSSSPASRLLVPYGSVVETETGDVYEVMTRGREDASPLTASIYGKQLVHNPLFCDTVWRRDTRQKKRFKRTSPEGCEEEIVEDGDGGLVVLDVVKVMDGLWEDNVLFGHAFIRK
eukprot:PhF_6_TR22741/c0_g1_i1/m.32419